MAVTDGSTSESMLWGYGDRLSLRAGESVEFKINCGEPTFRADVVRLFGLAEFAKEGSPHEQVMSADLSPHYPGRVQTTSMGSYCVGEVSAPASWDGVAMAAWICPTLLESAGQGTVISVGSAGGAVGLALAVTDRGCALVTADGQLVVESAVPLVEREWCFVSASVSAAGAVTLNQTPRGRASTVRIYREGTISMDPEAVIDHVWVAARQSASGPQAVFNGRIARPVVATAPWTDDATSMLVAGEAIDIVIGAGQRCAFDFTGDQSSSTVSDRDGLTSGGRLINLPARAVPGPFWTGTETDFRWSPDEYDAIHFHDDDVIDVGWATDLILDTPADWASGVYALKVHAARSIDYIPFVVSPTLTSGAGDDRADILLVLPTWTYLAYANWRSYAVDAEARADGYGGLRPPDPRDVWLAQHPELGASLYDVHRDGSGVMYSSHLRPIVSLRPDYYSPTANGPRHFGQDLMIVHWLASRGERFEVATDGDLERDGAELLKHYRVVLTGSHPEYCSQRMIDAYDEYTGDGGRLMYLGGNGFYWVTAQHPAVDGAIEIRRGRAGGTWSSEPGEGHLASTGEPGGQWRERGRQPQRLVGVGMAAQGFDRASAYRRTSTSWDPRVDWAFEGVPGETFGHEGGGLGGAAGDELDRADIALGTPPDAVVLASSFGHSDRYLLVPEELDRSPSAMPLAGAGSPKIRSDLVMFQRRGGGAVFSVGSIAWCGAICHRSGDNDIARITGNVLDAFRAAQEPMNPADAWHQRSR